MKGTKICKTDRLPNLTAKYEITVRNHNPVESFWNWFLTWHCLTVLSVIRKEEYNGVFRGMISSIKDQLLIQYSLSHLVKWGFKARINVQPNAATVAGAKKEIRTMWRSPLGHWNRAWRGFGVHSGFGYAIQYSSYISVKICRTRSREVSRASRKGITFVTSTAVTTFYCLKLFSPWLKDYSRQESIQERTLSTLG